MTMRYALPFAAEARFNEAAATAEWILKPAGICRGNEQWGLVPFERLHRYHRYAFTMERHRPDGIHQAYVVFHIDTKDAHHVRVTRGASIHQEREAAWWHQCEHGTAELESLLSTGLATLVRPEIHHWMERTRGAVRTSSRRVAALLYELGAEVGICFGAETTLRLLDVVPGDIDAFTDRVLGEYGMDLTTDRNAALREQVRVRTARHFAQTD